MTPPFDLLAGDFYGDVGAGTRTRWMREHAPVYFDERNDLWGIATYDGRARRRARPRDVLERGRQPSGHRPAAVDDRPGRRPTTTSGASS